MSAPVNTLTGLRVCSKCKREFPDSGFHGKTLAYCRECNLAYLKARRFGMRDAAESATLADGKVCVQCGDLKPATSFAKSNREMDRHAARCNDCREMLATARSLRKTPGKKRYHRLAKYGVSEAAYMGMLGQQQFACSICRQPHSVEKPLCVDHDHTTGHVRSLLCGHCNTAIGYFRDSPMFCRLAAEYLERHDNPSEGALQ